MLRACLLVALLSSFAVVAGESATTVVSSTDPATSATLPSWLSYILSFEFVWNALVTLGGALFVWLGKLLVGKAGEDKAKQEAVLALEAGVMKAYEEYVRDLKDKLVDGKLSVAERKEARDLAIKYAMEIAKGPGLAMLKAWGKPVLESLINKIVNKAKWNAKEGGS